MFILQKIPLFHIVAHIDFLLSIFLKDKQMSMRLMHLLTHLYLSNKFLSWKPNNARDFHNWNSMKYLADFNGHMILEKSNIQVDSLDKRNIGLMSNCTCSSGLR